MTKPYFSIITPSHNPKYLNKTMQSVLNQTCQDWEWIVALNGKAKGQWPDNNSGSVSADPRIKIVNLEGNLTNIGNIKRQAFNQGQGEVLIELDHDDLLCPNALDELKKVFKDKSVGFAYSDFAEFWDQTYEPHTYNSSSGWKYRQEKHNIDGVMRPVEVASAWEITPAVIGFILFAPNHVRAWRNSAYQAVGGHNPDLAVCDDHDLIIRTYLAGIKFYHIPECLYLYRCYKEQSYRVNQSAIIKKMWELYNDNIIAISLKWAKDNDLLALDLGGRFGIVPGFKTVDLKNADIKADLNQPWPFKDNSVGVIRAYDILEHLPDKKHTMKEIYRVLAPGGMLLSLTPSTDGRGAWQDPTHVSFWNENAFWYWVKSYIAKYIDNKDCMFIAHRLVTAFPSKWHEDNKIPYITADLTPIKAIRTPGLIE